MIFSLESIHLQLFTTITMSSSVTKSKKKEEK